MTALYAATGLSWPRTRRRPRATAGIPPESEEHFLQFVLDTMRQFGWVTYHTRSSRRSTAGYPDISALRPPRQIAAECKTDVGIVKIEQAMWLDLFRQCGVEAFVWRPADKAEIVRILR